MATFNDMIFYLASIGVADVLIPFLLTFVLIYAILQQSKILGHRPHPTKENKTLPKPKLNLVVAFVMGFAVVTPHVMGRYPPAFDPVVIINTMLPKASILLVTIISFGIIVALWGVKWNLEKGGANWVVWFCLLATAYIFVTSSGYFGLSFPRWLSWLNNPGNVSLLVTLLVFFGIVGLITRDGDKKDLTKEQFKEMWDDEDARKKYLDRRFLERNFPSEKH